jgi:hypothetical protein
MMQYSLSSGNDTKGKDKNMGHSNLLHSAMMLAGMFTMGGAFGAATNSAQASVAQSVIELAPIIIASLAPKDACTDFEFESQDDPEHDGDLAVVCYDGDVSGTYDPDHYAVMPSIDGAPIYVVVWQ